MYNKYVIKRDYEINSLKEVMKMANTFKYYWFTFEDGYSTCTRGFDRIEMQHMVLKHGRLISKVLA